MHTGHPIGFAAPAGAPDVSTFGRILDDLEPLAVDVVEVPLCDLDVLAGARAIPSRLARLKEACAGRPFALSLHGPIGFNLLDEPARLPLHLDVARATLDVAAGIAARHVVLHSGTVYGGRKSAEITAAYERQRDGFASLAEAAADRGLVICVENVFNFDAGCHTALPGRLAGELAAIAHPSLAATLDVSHAYLQAAVKGAEPWAEVRALAPHARHVHIHDSFGRRPDFWVYSRSESIAFGLGDLHLPLGWGDIPWDSLFADIALPDEAILMIELDARHAGEAAETVAFARRLAALRAEAAAA